MPKANAPSMPARPRLHVAAMSIPTTTGPRAGSAPSSHDRRSTSSRRSCARTEYPPPKPATPSYSATPSGAPASSPRPPWCLPRRDGWASRSIPPERDSAGRIALRRKDREFFPRAPGRIPGHCFRRRSGEGGTRVGTLGMRPAYGQTVPCDLREPSKCSPCCSSPFQRPPHGRRRVPTWRRCEG